MIYQIVINGKPMPDIDSAWAEDALSEIADSIFDQINQNYQKPVTITMTVPAEGVTQYEISY